MRRAGNKDISLNFASVNYIFAAWPVQVAIICTAFDTAEVFVSRSISNHNQSLFYIIDAAYYVSFIFLYLYSPKNEKCSAQVTRVSPM
jgi:hypothetical protein